MINRLDNLTRSLGPTARLRIFGALKIPLLALVNPRVLQLNDDVCEIKIPLNYLTRNHLGSMYFGTMAIGADCAAGMHALHIAERAGEKRMALVFKSFQADFTKRAEDDVVFRCEAGKLIREMIAEIVSTGERVTREIPVEAFTVRNGLESVAKFTLGLSLKGVKT